MEARAVVRHVRMSPRKMRVVANLVRGKRVDEAMSMLKLMPKKGAGVIRKLIVCWMILMSSVQHLPTGLRPNHCPMTPPKF